MTLAVATNSLLVSCIIYCPVVRVFNYSNKTCKNKYYRTGTNLHNPYGFQQPFPMTKAIVITIDQLGARFLSLYGNTWNPTPAFDRLAARGLTTEFCLEQVPRD